MLCINPYWSVDVSFISCEVFQSTMLDKFYSQEFTKILVQHVQKGTYKNFGSDLSLLLANFIGFKSDVFLSVTTSINMPHQLQVKSQTVQCTMFLSSSQGTQSSQCEITVLTVSVILQGWMH